jgi:uncharacterized iron-regulated protein
MQLLRQHFKRVAFLAVAACGFSIPAVLVAEEQKTRPDVQQLAIGDPARRERQAPVLLDGVTDTATNEVIDTTILTQRLRDVRVLFIGETHTDAESHRVQLSVIRALHAAGREVILGLEMFPYTTVEPLEQWIQGKLSESQFLERAKWYETWAHHWNNYREIFLFARHQRLRMVGVNAPREVVRTVRANGLDALDASTRKRMPPSLDTANPEHRQLVRSYFEADDLLHTKMPPEQLEGLYLAQVTWDAAMGWNAGQVLTVPANPREIVVVLIGSGHVAYGLGAERQLAPHFKGRIASLIPVTVHQGPEGNPVASVRASYANYIWGVPWTAQPSWPLLGVSLAGRIGTEPSKVIQVDPGSTAAQAGIKVGDILRVLDGTKIDGTTALQRKTGDYAWGDAAKLTIEREGQSLMFDIVFRRAPKP